MTPVSTHMDDRHIEFRIALYDPHSPKPQVLRWVPLQTITSDHPHAARSDHRAIQQPRGVLAIERDSTDLVSNHMRSRQHVAIIREGHGVGDALDGAEKVFSRWKIRIKTRPHADGLRFVKLRSPLVPGDWRRARTQQTAQTDERRHKWIETRLPKTYAVWPR